jgi:hypothetical protein
MFTSSQRSFLINIEKGNATCGVLCILIALKPKNWSQQCQALRKHGLKR